MPAGGEEGSGSSAAVRMTQQGSWYWFQHPLGCGRGAACAGAVGAAALAGLPFHRESHNGSVRRSQNSSGCCKLQDFGLKPPNSKTMRPALKLAAAQWELPLCAAELQDSRRLVIAAVSQQS